MGGCPLGFHVQTTPNGYPQKRQYEDSKQPACFRVGNEGRAPELDSLGVQMFNNLELQKGKLPSQGEASKLQNVYL